MVLRFREASKEEKRSEHEAKHDRDRPVVPPHPPPQRLEYGRCPLWGGHVETDERENRYGEDHDNEPERRDAGPGAKA